MRRKGTPKRGRSGRPRFRPPSPLLHLRFTTASLCGRLAGGTDGPRAPKRGCVACGSGVGLGRALTKVKPTGRLTGAGGSAGGFAEVSCVFPRHPLTPPGHAAAAGPLKGAMPFGTAARPSRVHRRVSTATGGPLVTAVRPLSRDAVVFRRQASKAGTAVKVRLVQALSWTWLVHKAISSARRGINTLQTFT